MSSDGNNPDNPNAEPDYFEQQKKQKRDAFNMDAAKAKRFVKKRLEKIQQAKVLPRYLLRALESGDPGRVEACIDKAMGEGWTEDDLNQAVENKIAELTGA